MARRERRKPFRRRSIRAAWLDAVLQRWPELEPELTELRRQHAQGYRKRLFLLARALGLTGPQAPREVSNDPTDDSLSAPDPAPAPASSAPPEGA